jgi:hypothetical protein
MHADKAKAATIENVNRWKACMIELPLIPGGSCRANKCDKCPVTQASDT